MDKRLYALLTGIATATNAALHAAARGAPFEIDERIWFKPLHAHFLEHVPECAGVPALTIGMRRDENLRMTVTLTVHWRTHDKKDLFRICFFPFDGLTPVGVGAP